VSNLREYLHQKRAAILSRREAAIASPPTVPHVLSAHVKAEGRSGVRRIRIRDHQILSDSGSDFAGYDFGPGSPEIQVGVLGSCLTHIFEIQAADREIWLDSLEVHVQAEQDPRAGTPGFEHIPFWPHNITYAVNIESDASEDRIQELHQAVEAICPILNLLVNPQSISGTVTLNGRANVSQLTAGPTGPAVATVAD
jgi:uncharacterized OsmC-like protein